MTGSNKSHHYTQRSPAFFLAYFFALFIALIGATQPALADEGGIAAASLAEAGQGNEAAEELRRFGAPQLRTRYYALLDQLRCPKCQNQNLADSDAPIAADLRNELFRLLHENYSDEQIREYMVARYGSFVLYSPPPSAYTAVLWLLPVALMAVCAVLVWRITRAGNAVELAAQLNREAQND
ncbi:MAG: cytochrome c-type biogenesis protein [Pseudomonadales bacterium]